MSLLHRLRTTVFLEAQQDWPSERPQVVRDRFELRDFLGVAELMYHHLREKADDAEEMRWVSRVYCHAFERILHEPDTDDFIRRATQDQSTDQETG